MNRFSKKASPRALLRRWGRRLAAVPPERARTLARHLAAWLRERLINLDRGLRTDYANALRAIFARHSTVSVPAGRPQGHHEGFEFGFFPQKE